MDANAFDWAQQVGLISRRARPSDVLKETEALVEQLYVEANGEIEDEVAAEVSLLKQEFEMGTLSRRQYDEQRNEVLATAARRQARRNQLVA